MFAGHGSDGPTLEIFQYNPQQEKFEITSDTPGVSHIAFAVNDVKEIATQFLEWGGKEVGEYTEMNVEGAGHIILHYLADPEGNIIETCKPGRRSRSRYGFQRFKRNFMRKHIFASSYGGGDAGSFAHDYGVSCYTITTVCDEVAADTATRQH